MMKSTLLLLALLVASVHSETCPNMKGEPGDEGMPGEPGASGLPGLVGYRGRPGFPGGEGDRGQPGAPGVIGEKGAKGIRGLASSPGTRPFIRVGDAGDKGDKGVQGPVGIPGKPGTRGIDGKKGSTGWAGEPGPQGNCDAEGPCPHVAFAGQALGVQQDKQEQLVDLNVLTDSCQGGCYSSQSGFTAPFSGVYTFGITAVANGDGAVPLILYKNDDAIATTARSSSSAVGILPHSTIQVNVPLETGDTVALKIKGRGSGIGSTLTGWFRDPTDVIFIGHSVPTL